VREYGKLHPQVLLLENPEIAEKGTVCAMGCCMRGATFCLFTDADLSSPMTEAQNCSTDWPRRRYRDRIALAARGTAD